MRQLQWPSDLDATSTGDADLERLLTRGCGASFYAAPEVLLKMPYGLPVDVCALGVIWRELVTSSCQTWIELPVPNDQPRSLAQRLKMCVLLAGPINAKTLPGCEEMVNQKQCVEELRGVQRLRWPRDLTKLQTAMRPLIETALHLQPSLRATTGQLKMRTRKCRAH